MGNSSFQGSKLEFQSLETNRFTKEIHYMAMCWD